MPDIKKDIVITKHFSHGSLAIRSHASIFYDNSLSTLTHIEMSKILDAKGIDHWFDVRGQQKHDWPLWREMFPHYLSLITGS